MGGDPYRNIKMDEGIDRVCALLGNTGVGKSSFINSITNTKECKIGKEATSCTSKIKVVQKRFEDKNFYFIDTPGLDDGKGDKQNMDELDKLREYPRINSLLICLRYNDSKLSESVKKALKKFMDIFPSQDFWTHVIIIRTWTQIRGDILERHKNTYKGKILNGIINDKELNEYMSKRNINLPSILKEFYVDCDEEVEELDENTLQEFNNILNEIKKKYPIYKQIKMDNEEETVKEVKRDNSTFLNIITKRKITFIDFNDITHEIIETVNNEYYNLDGIKPLLIEVKRVQDEQPRGILCWSNQFKTHYNIVKIYNIEGQNRRIEYEIESRYESKKKEDEIRGEEYKEQLQKNFSNTCQMA